jgi:hypothetical protein
MLLCIYQNELLKTINNCSLEKIFERRLFELDYLQVYNDLIERGRNRLRWWGCDSHHIIPINEGGTNDIANLSFVTRQEHYLIHLLRYRLWEKISDKKSYVRLYSTRDLVREKHPCWNKPRSPEVRAKIALGMIGKNVGKKPWNYGRKYSWKLWGTEGKPPLMTIETNCVILNSLQ